MGRDDAARPRAGDGSFRAPRDEGFRAVANSLRQAYPPARDDERLGELLSRMDGGWR